jgi:putative effector of murein hydrolase
MIGGIYGLLSVIVVMTGVEVGMLANILKKLDNIEKRLEKIENG